MKKRKIQIAAGFVLLMTAVLINTQKEWLRITLFVLAYLTVGWDILLTAAKNAIKGKVLDENFLMSVATIGTFFIAQYAEGVAVMLFYQVGELFQSHAVAKSRRSIAGLMAIRPEYANIERGEELVKQSPDEIKVGQIIVIKPGEKIPLDAVVVDGFSAVDISALTGEALPKDVSPDSQLISGCINLSGVLTARVTKEYGESTVNKILDLVENATAKKSQSERFITKFARIYTPAVVVIAAVLAVAPPLVLQQSFDIWVYRALTFLVVSCPCALVIGVPVSNVAGIGNGARNGILLKGSEVISDFSRVDTVVFDKTGTLTKGVFAVQRIHAEGMPEAALLELAAYAESFSSHPISLSLKNAYGSELLSGKVTRAEEIAGFGVSATVDGKEVFAGNTKLMQKLKIPYKDESDGTVVHVAVDKKYAGYIVIADELKDDAIQAVRQLKDSAKQTVMLTGDNERAAQKAAVLMLSALGITTMWAAIFADVGVTILAVLNAFRALVFK